MLASVNRDERVFIDPDRLDLRRADVTRHVTFGNGNHFCVGAPITRLAMRVSLPLLVEMHGTRTRDRAGARRAL